jgi:5-methylcytosine-specific restriction endonuclease McrBC regulatory subunit McrC
MPDIVISKQGSTLFIIDTKYKTIANEDDAMRSDISQVLDYCLVFKIKNALLLYPKIEKQIHNEYLIKNTDIRITVETIDLSFNRQQENENISKFRDIIMNEFLV